MSHLRIIARYCFWFVLYVDTKANLRFNTRPQLSQGSAKVTGGPPGLQIRCGALKPSQVGSIPMHFRQSFQIISH